MGYGSAQFSLKSKYRGRGVRTEGDKLRIRLRDKFFIDHQYQLSRVES